MKVAFLFNSDSPDLGNCYGFPIMEKIVCAGVLQNTKRHMRVSIGDVSTYGHLDRIDQLRSVYEPNIWDRRKTLALEATFNKATVFCWMFQNISEKTAQSLHEALFKEPSYLGAIDLNYAHLPHLAFFARGLIERYRLHDGICSVFYHMGSHETSDVADEEIFGKGGITVKYEDIGARRTIFDNYYDSPEHHKRVSQFANFFSEQLDWSSDNISEISLNLEELHPYLFNILYASSMALKNAEVIEQLSQSYLSGRRFIEHIADFLYPHRDAQFLCKDGKSRDVKQDNYINRLAAFVETTLISLNKFDAGLLSKLGREADELYEIFCRGVHKPFSDEEEFNEEEFNNETDHCKNALSRLGRLTVEIINIDPASIRRPYLAYGKEIHKLFKSRKRQNRKNRG